MTDVANLELQVGSSDVNVASKRLNDLTNNAGKAEGATKRLASATDGLAEKAKLLAAAFSAFKAAEALVENQRAFDKLNSALITATGSAANASKAFGALQIFAASTPYSLQETTKAFIQLRNLGLTPSERALQAYGNTAAAMSKSLDQMVEAVADAATGEFERLKEFGIKASQENGKVALTFQGHTTTITNSAKNIEEYLIRLGETKFAGGMELQSKTLDGALSNLGDTWDMLLQSFNNAGFAETAQSSVLSLSGALSDLTAIVDAVSGGMEIGAGKAEEYSIAHAALRTTFEAITILGMNVAFTFQAIGKDLGAMAAQAVAFAKADSMAEGLKAVKEIGEARVADAVEERRLLDANIEKVLWAADVRAKVAENEKERKKREREDTLAGFRVQQAGNQLTKEQLDLLKKWAEEYKKIREEIAERVATIQLELQYNDKLTDGQKYALKVMEDLRAGNLRLTAAKQIKLAKDLEEYLLLERIQDAREADKKALEEQAKALKASTDEVWDQVKATEEQVKAYGKSAISLTELRLAQEQAKLTAYELSQEEEAAINSRIAGLNRLREEQYKLLSKEQRQAIMEEDAKMWESFDRTAHDTFISVANGGKDLATRLKESFKNIFFDWLYQMTLKKWLVNISGSFGSSAAGSALASSGSSALGGTGSSALSQGFSLVNMGKSIYGAISGGFAELSTSIADAVQSGMYATGMTGQIASNGSVATGVGAAGAAFAGIAGGVIGGNFISGGYSALGGSSTNATAIGTAIGTVILPGIGSLVGGLIGGAVNRLFGMKPKEYGEMGLTGTLGSDNSFSGQNYAKWTQKGGWFRSNKSGTEFASVDSGQAKALSDAYTMLKSITGGFGETIGASADSLKALAERVQAVSIVFGKTEEENQKAISDFFTTVADKMANELVPNLSTFSKEGESASATLQRLAGDYSALDVALQALGETSEQAFGAVGIASLKAREQLIAAAGGLDALVSGLTYFQQNFLTDAERLAPVAKSVHEQMEKLGYGSITTVQQFKDLVLGFDRSTEDGAKLYVQLLALAPAFKQVADSAQSAAEVAAQAAATQASAAREAKMKVLDSAMGVLSRSVSLRKDQLQKEYDSQVALINAQADAARDATNARLQAAQKEASALQSVYGRVASTFSSLRKMTREEGIKVLETAAKNKGSLSNTPNLDEALSAVGSQDTSKYATMLDFQRDQARAASLIGDLRDTASTQLEAANRQVELQQDMLAAIEASRQAQLDQAKRLHDEQQTRLDRALEAAQAQIDAINGVDKSVLTVAQAIAAFNSASGAAGGGSISDPGVGGSVPGGGGFTGTWQAPPGVFGPGGTPASQPMFWENTEWDWFRNGPIKGYASGGQHDGGWRMVGETGPEVEFTGASRIVSHEQTKKMFQQDNRELVAAIDNLTGAVENQRVLIEKLERNAKITADILLNVSQGGNTLKTS
jgi:hypothetical protein